MTENDTSNPFDVMQSPFASLYVFGKCLVLLAQLPKIERLLVIEQLKILCK